MKRRDFLTSATIAAAGISLTSATPDFNMKETGKTITLPFDNDPKHKRFRPKNKAGFGGNAVGDAFGRNPDIECLQSLEAAWDAGVRYFDTSPWYGLGVSERREGMFLKDKRKEDFTISSKVGRILIPHEDYKLKGTLSDRKYNFSYKYDYTAAGVRRSIEDSLQRLGLSSLDIVFIHDLEPQNRDFNGNWEYYFDQAQKGAMPELTKMREEGIIKAWGLGVNMIEPILKTLEVADPDIFLSAMQYDLIKHEDDLNKVFPKVMERDASIVVGTPLCVGFLAGKDRYMYGGNFPNNVRAKLAALKRVAANHQVDLRTAALQFAAAPEVVSGVIPGAHTVQQAQENAASFFKETIPAGFWEELKSSQLIAANAPIPESIK